MTVFGLIGYPLTHSFSATYFNHKFEKEGIKDHSYRLFPLPFLKDLPLILKTPGLRGLNITVPYKQTIIPWLDEIDEFALKTGAVNTINIIHRKEKQILKGYNTDSEGFIKSTDFSRFKKALILGTGGASKAVQFALASLNINFDVVSRSPKPFSHLLYTDLNREIITSHDLIINTTPLGMYPDKDSYPEIPYEYLSNKHFLYDLVYNPDTTTFLKKGVEQGASVMNGLKMLYLQAEKAFEIWNKNEK